MADDADLAQDALDRAMSAAERDLLRPSTIAESALICADCEEPIPEARRKAQPGCRLCVSCQEAREIHSHWRAL